MSSENYLKVPTIPSCLLAQQQQKVPQFTISNSSLSSTGGGGGGGGGIGGSASLSPPTITTSGPYGRGSSTNLRDSGCNLIRVPWKIVLLGDAGVGKSSLVRQLLNGGFSMNYNPTVEDSYQHNINLPDGLSQCIEILDTSGFYQFPAMRELNIRLGSAFILVFDLGKEETLNSLICLHREIIKIKGSDKTPMILVGNKLDISTTTPVAPDTAIVEAVARKAMNLAQTTFKCPYIETSAKENLNVTKIFTLVAEQIYREIEAAIEAMNNANDAANGAGSARRNSTISFVVRRISSTNLSVKPIERLSRRFSEPVACAEAVANPGQQSQQQQSHQQPVASSMLLTATSASTLQDAQLSSKTCSISSISNKNLKHSASGSTKESSSTLSSGTKKKQKNCTIS